MRGKIKGCSLTAKLTNNFNMGLLSWDFDEKNLSE
jgi:hypothetical protein